MADKISAVDRNEILGFISDTLRKGKDIGNNAHIPDQVPLLGGMGLGDIFFGKSPEFMDDVSYNPRSAIRGGNRATGGLGTYTLDPRVADTAFVGLDAIGLSKLSAKSAKALTDKAVNEYVAKVLNKPMQSSRRDFLETMGKGAAITAAGGGALAAARKLGKETVNHATEVAPKVADNAAVAATKKYRFNSLKDYLNEIDYRAEMDLLDRFDPPTSAHYAEDDLYGAGEDWVKNMRNTESEMLLRDAHGYRQSKYLDANQLEPPPMAVEINPITGEHEVLDYLDAFSPEAKQQMKRYKQFVEDSNNSESFALGNWYENPMEKIQKLGQGARQSLGFE